MSSVIISGDTSGAVTLTVPAVAGTNTVTIPASTGTVMVSGNMPAFSAYQSSVQTLPTNTSTKLLFQTEEFDTNSNFASSTFTPTVAGYYQVSGGFAVGTAACGTRLQIFKNGSVFKTLFNAQSTTVNGAYGSALVYLNGSTDYVELYGVASVGQVLLTGIETNYFQASMVRGA
jgi:hypothetical protein